MIIKAEILCDFPDQLADYYRETSDDRVPSLILTDLIKEELSERGIKIMIAEAQEVIIKKDELDALRQRQFIRHGLGHGDIDIESALEDIDTLLACLDAALNVEQQMRIIGKASQGSTLEPWADLLLAALLGNKENNENKPNSK